MAKYSKQVSNKPDGSEIVRYKDGDTVVPESKVPTNVVNALAQARPGTVVDELGDPINPETDVDESADEDSPEGTDDTTDDDSDDDDDEDETPAPTPKKKKSSKRRKQVEDDEEFETDDEGNEVGMGFPRHNGKTGDIFDVKVPHTQVRPVAGLMVPLSTVNALGDPRNDIAPKTDVEIYKQLEKLGLV